MMTKSLRYYCIPRNFSTLLLSTAISLMLFSCGQKQEQSTADSTTDTENTAQENVENTTKSEDKKVILFFGNSLTAGYGLEPEQAFPALIQKKLDSLNLDYQVVNAGLSGETTASGDSRLEWVLERQDIDIFVLELGANDGLRGIPTEETNRNLRSMIAKVKEANADAKIILAGMMVPPNMGPEYSNRFQKLYPAIAEEENVMLIPFLLQNVAGETELNQGDGIHPTAEGQEIVANNVWQVMKDAIEEIPNS
ncbi:acyl-CoA thioesterase-1 [Catalinimonas alkaloidigena]|uniref:arylesterase n=1 Tax=Catalinimonas alkaloidigena TaxID=1075417 RepID=UPI002406775E|nr:arylesterase [Catalinimonas alkaloidigena]MDF9796147.1 acyl-CoA thioesterase-1 [Catalinimonas alkaloidigena]